MTALEALKTRRSIRAYQDRPVPREVLLDLCDCARLAPSAMNQQLNELVIITQRTTFEALAEHIAHSSWIAHAPAGIAVLCKESKFYAEDAANAMHALLLAARAHGLGSCWISGDKQPYADRVRQLLGAPANTRFFALAIVGYAAEDVTKDKRPLESLVHWEKY